MDYFLQWFINQTGTESLQVAITIYQQTNSPSVILWTVNSRTRQVATR